MNISIKNGDHKAFIILYDKHAKEMYHFMKRYIQSSEVIDDLIHDTFINLWNARARINTNKPIQPYLYRIARNLMFKEIKKQIIQANLFVDVNQAENKVSSQYCIENMLYEKEYFTIYNLAINRLPPQRKRVFRMSREEGLSYSEIAGSLEISTQTVKEHMSLAMKSIKEYIAKEHDILLKAVIFALIFEKI